MAYPYGGMDYTSATFWTVRKNSWSWSSECKTKQEGTILLWEAETLRNQTWLFSRQRWGEGVGGQAGQEEGYLGTIMIIIIIIVIMMIRSRGTVGQCNNCCNLNSQLQAVYRLYFVVFRTSYINLLLAPQVLL